MGRGVGARCPSSTISSKTSPRATSSSSTTKIESLDGEIVRVKIALPDVPEVLSSCARGLIFAIGALSFHDARPRGYSDRDFVENEEWTIADTLKDLRYEHGRLHFRADYVGDPLRKDDVNIDGEGKIVVETSNRGRLRRGGSRS
jgi:hypothetical protein